MPNHTGHRALLVSCECRLPVRANQRWMQPKPDRDPVRLVEWYSTLPPPPMHRPWCDPGTPSERTHVGDRQLFEREPLRLRPALHHRPLPRSAARRRPSAGPATSSCRGMADTTSASSSDRPSRPQPSVPGDRRAFQPRRSADIGCRHVSRSGPATSATALPVVFVCFPPLASACALHMVAGSGTQAEGALSYVSAAPSHARLLSQACRETVDQLRRCVAIAARAV